MKPSGFIKYQGGPVRVREAEPGVYVTSSDSFRGVDARTGEPRMVNIRRSDVDAKVAASAPPAPSRR